MPEYLHPGVYIEETSFRGKPIEGVSTSTAGLVGRTSRGPDGKPTLVTSLAQFVRTFGPPAPIAAGVTPGLGDYLGHAVRAFFENGGLRAYIVRTLPSDGSALIASRPLSSGTIVMMPPNKVLRPGQLVIPLTSLRGIGAPLPTLRMFIRPNATSPFASPVSLTLASIDPLRNEVTLSAALTAANLGGQSASAANVYFDLGTAAASGGPTFQAQYRGEDGNQLAVQIRPADRPPVDIVSGAPAAAPKTLTVSSTAGFYEGATVEIARGGATKEYAFVESVDPIARTVTIDTPLSAALGTGPYLRTLEIDVLVYQDGLVKESFLGLSWNSDNTLQSFSRFFVERINDPATGSKLVRVVTPVTTTGVLSDQPTTPEGVPLALLGGDNGNPLVATDLIGTDNGPGARTGIEALRERDDIALVAVPGVTDTDVQQALITHCELLKYRFAVLDGLINTSDISAIQAHRNHFDTKYAGYYTPWLKTLDLATGREISVPPSGHVLGICARVDNERGVWKAPANEVVRGINDLELRFGDGEQDVLNPVGINLIREFEGRGIRVWGGRTLSSDQEWRYVNVRRLFIFLEHSIDRGTQWVVFEPNTEALWQRVVSTIKSFLFGVWKSGALMGTTPEEAYFVRCDRTTMTQDDIDNGRLVCLIGVAPTYPAEFVIFRIGQFTASTNQA